MGRRSRSRVPGMSGATLATGTPEQRLRGADRGSAEERGRASQQLSTPPFHHPLQVSGYDLLASQGHCDLPGSLTNILCG